MITVVNIYKLDGLSLSDCIYIGRNNYRFNLMGSALANPFPLKEYSRKESLNRYKEWLNEKLKNKDSVQYKEIMRLKGLLNEGKDIYLLCYCEPKECHGDYIKYILDKNN